jgi:uncharacterized protein YbjT (DUF2867 family)
VILITGASGTNGTELIKLLVEKGIPVRAMSRKPPASGQHGAEFVAADFDDAESIRRALEGVAQAFLVMPSSAKVEEQQLGFVEAARSAGVRNLVYLSQLHSTTDSPVRFLRYHAVVEDAIKSSGMTFTHLRPNLFIQGLLAFASSIKSDGRFYARLAMHE